MTMIHLRSALRASAECNRREYRQPSESCFNVTCNLFASSAIEPQSKPFSFGIIGKKMNRFLLSSRILRSSAPLQRRMASTNANFVVLGDSSALKGIVESSESKVLYFTATWCPPCKMIAPVFEKLSKDFPNTKFVKIDIDDHSDAAADYNIRSVPTFMFFHGKDLKQQV